MAPVKKGNESMVYAMYSIVYNVFFKLPQETK